MAQRAPRRIPDFTQARDPLAHFSLDIILDRFEERLTRALTTAVIEALRAQKPGPRPAPTQLLLSADEAAAMLGKSRSWVNQMSKAGLILRRQVGKSVSYRRADIERIAREGLSLDGGE